MSIHQLPIDNTASAEDQLKQSDNLFDEFTKNFPYGQEFTVEFKFVIKHHDLQYFKETIEYMWKIHTDLDTIAVTELPEYKFVVAVKMYDPLMLV